MPSRRSFLAALGAAAATATAGCTASLPHDDPSGSWVTAGADPGRTGHRADVDGPADLGGGWVVDLPNRDLGGVSPVVRDGTVYAAWSEDVRAARPRSFVGAYDAATGETRWTTEAARVEGPNWHPDEPHTDSLVVDDRGIYLQTAAGLLALDFEGERRWLAENVDADIALFGLGHPVVDGDVVYAAGYDADEAASTVAAYDAADGDQLWRYAFGDARAPSPPALAEGTLLVADRMRRLVAIDAENGAEAWRRELGVNSPATVADGRIHLHVYENETADAVALGLDDGEERWRTEVGDTTRGSVPTTDGSAVYLVARPGVYAYDAASGEALWTFDADAELGYESAFVEFRRAQPALAASGLYVGGGVTLADAGTCATVLVLDPATGDPRDVRVFERANGSLRGGVAVVDGWIYAASPRTGHLFGVRECSFGALGRCLY